MLSEPSAKDENYWRILNAVLHFEVTKGHLKWKVSEVARSAGVTRTLIYYYFGKSKLEILEVGMKLIGEEFFGLSPHRLEMWRKGEFVESVIKTRELVDKTPSMLIFYLTWRSKEGEIQKKLIELEDRHCKKLQQYFPHLTKDAAACVLGVLFGLTAAPHLNLKSNQHIIDMIFKIVKSKPKEP